MFVTLLTQPQGYTVSQLQDACMHQSRNIHSRVHPISIQIKQEPTRDIANLQSAPAHARPKPQAASQAQFSFFSIKEKEEKKKRGGHPRQVNFFLMNKQRGRAIAPATVFFFPSTSVHFTMTVGLESNGRLLLPNLDRHCSFFSSRPNQSRFCLPRWRRRGEPPRPCLGRGR